MCFYKREGIVATVVVVMFIYAENIGKNIKVFIRRIKIFYFCIYIIEYCVKSNCMDVENMGKIMMYCVSEVKYIIFGIIRFCLRFKEAKLCVLSIFYIGGESIMYSEVYL